MARTRKPKGNVRKVDFSQEVRYFETDSEYEVEVKSAAWEDGNEHAYIAIEFKGTDDDNEDSTLYHNASISPKALSRTRIVLEALGIDCPVGEAIEIDPADLVGQRCMIHTFTDKYKGNDGETKTSVKADDFWPVEDKKSKKGGTKKKDADEDDKPAKGKAGKKSKKEPEVEKIERSDIEGLSRKKLLALIDEHELEDDVDADSRKLKKDDEALAEAIIEALDEKGLIAEDEPEPAKGKGKAGSKAGSSKSKGKSKSKTWTEDEIDEMDEEELAAVIEEADIELDLEDHRTLRKKKNALKDALEEAGKIAE